MTTKTLQKRNSNVESIKASGSEDKQSFAESGKGVIPKLDDRFITNIKGKDFVLYAGVLDLATQKGLLKLEVTLLQFPSKENDYEAVCRAVAESKTGAVFSDIGDANPKNCHELIVKHLIRMASTRAKARCLRDMCNISIACLEEIADLDDVLGSESNGNNHGRGTNTADRVGSKTVRGGKQTAKGKIGKGKQLDSKSNSTPTKSSKSNPDGTKDSYPTMSEAQKRAIENLARRRGVTENQELHSKVMDTYGCPFEDLSAPQASELIRNLQQNA
jgi:hypothetical protein